jgi:hypothetical protein
MRICDREWEKTGLRVMEVERTCCSSEAHDVPIGLFNGDSELIAVLGCDAESLGDE